jgi:CDP-paratose 2-epimerase
MRSVLVTGSAGLVGSATVARFARLGARVIGVDNDQRAAFFGASASTRPTRRALEERWPSYVHHDADIRNAPAVTRIFEEHGADLELIVHAAAQPSHDWAATAPRVDFQVNATATLELLELTRAHCPGATFVYVSTNKVYGDTPNALPRVEQPTRYELEPAHPFAERGIDESMSVDTTMHSLFGVSKLAADVMVQEYGRYFGLRTACFRCGCITGAAHAGAPLHGFLAYLMRCAVRREPYVIHGYEGKQVRDNLHADDLAAAFEAFHARPRAGAVYNMGGGRIASCSVREAIALAERASGNTMEVSYDATARRGDHVWWISDVARFERDHPTWKREHDLASVIASVYDGAVRASR